MSNARLPLHSGHIGARLIEMTKIQRTGSMDYNRCIASLSTGAATPRLVGREVFHTQQLIEIGPLTALRRNVVSSRLCTNLNPLRHLR